MLAKIKQWLGIGGVKIQCQPDNAMIFNPPSMMAGKVMLSSKSDQFVTSVVLTIMEKRTTGRGEEKKTREFELGRYDAIQDVAIKANQPQSLDFAIPYTINNTVMDDLANKGGALGALGKIGKFADNEKTEFVLHAHAKVKGTAFGASHTVQLTFKNLN